MKSRRIKVKDQLWTVKLMTSAEYIHSFTDDSWAITLKDEYTICFREDRVDLATTSHELFHAYVFGLHLTSAELSSDQLEEIVAEFLGQYLEKLYKQSRLLLRWLIAAKG